MNIELSETQIRCIVWLMEDKISQPVMALPQFAEMRAAKEMLKAALTASETKGESMFKPLKDGLCVTCGRDARNHDFGGACRTGSAMEDLAALNRGAESK